MDNGIGRRYNVWRDERAISSSRVWLVKVGVGISTGDFDRVSWDTLRVGPRRECDLSFDV